MKDFSEINDLVESVKCRMQDAYEQGYETGYKDGRKKQAEQNNKDIFGIDEGFANAWEFTRMIVLDTETGGLDTETLKDLFGNSNPYRIFKDTSIYEAEQKFKEYKQKQANEISSDEIKVGDEIENNGILGIVTFLEDKPFFQVICSDGSLGHWAKSEVVKTGKSFPQITEVLEQLKGENKK